MVIFLFIIFFNFFNLLCSNVNKYNISYNYLNEAETISDCSDYLIGIKNIDIDGIICFLEAFKNDPVNSTLAIKAFNGIILNKIQDYLNENNITFLNEFVNDIFNLSLGFIDNLFDFIKKNGTFIDYIIDILNYNGTEKFDFIFEKVILILNMDGIDNITNFLISPERNIAILFLIEKFIQNTDYSKLYFYFKPFFEKYKDLLFNVLPEIIKNFKDSDKITDIIEKLFLDNKNNSFLTDLKDIFLKENVSEEFAHSINLTNYNMNIIKNEVLKDKKFIAGFFDLLLKGDMIEKFAGLLRNLKNSTYIIEEVPNMLNYIYIIDNEFVQPILDMATNILEILVEEDSFNNFVSIKFTKMLNETFFNNEFEKYNVSRKCIDLMDTVFFKNFLDDPDISEKINNSIINKSDVENHLNYMRFFYLRKIFFDTTKDKNDFSTYENCLNKEFDNTRIQTLNINFDIQPVYVIGIFDDKINKSNLNNDSILLEKYNNLLSYCLPYGKLKISSDTEMCSKTDYENIIRIFLDIPFNMKTSEVDSFKIYNKTFNSKEYFLCFLTIFILLIPILFRSFLSIYDKISFVRYLKKEKIEKINELIYDENENENDNKKDPKLVYKIKRKNYKLNAPCWFKYLNEYFSLKRNGAELFDFKSKESILNNVNGLTYIKGLLGISMILYIFGQTFIALFNLPFKNFTLSEFNSSLRNPLYVIPLIGLRYSPRVILSCSGYTLMYKFLCFIEKERNFYLPKFFLIQSYKYILLILVILFMRYSFYYINIPFNNTKRPMLEILKYILEYDYDNSFKIFFTFLINYVGDFSIQWKQNLIQYFYMPINEVFLFIIGTIIISIGYKFKLKIDIAIIVIVLIVFILKVLFFVLYAYDNKKYPTLYFYLYDYGGYMLNPFFNLPSFFIGMYFGLINYSIQRGVNLYSNQSYQRIYSIANKEESFSINEPETDNVEEFTKKGTMVIDNNYAPKLIELNNYDYINSKNMYYQQQQEDDNARSYSQDLIKIPSSKKKKVKTNISKTNTESNYDSSKSFISGDYNQKIMDMPFLIFPTKFLNFHRQNGDKFYFIIIIFLFILLFIFFSCVHFIYILKYSLADGNKSDDKEILEKLSFQKMITNYLLNFIYVIDIDLVVLMINWGFFILYSKGYKTADMYDFFNNNFWSFFIKCYYSFIIFSSPIILIIFYQSETVIKFTLINVILFSSINLFIIFLVVIILYSLYEMPLKKIFKSILVKDEILNDNSDDEENETDEYYSMEELKEWKN